MYRYFLRSFIGHDFVELDRGIQEQYFGVGVAFYIVNVVVEQFDGLGNFGNIEHFGHVFGGLEFVGAQACAVGVLRSE